MPELHILTLFFGSALLLALTPGPDNLYVLNQSAQHGRAAGLWLTLGLCSGLLLHMAALALGLALLIKTTPYVLQIIQYIGAAYLLYLASLIWRTEPALTNTEVLPVRRARALYLRGVIMNISNPKVLLFFLALLPQFTQPERGSPTLQIVVLSGLFILATFLVFGGISLMADKLRLQLRRWTRRLDHLTATLFVIIALRLFIAGWSA